MDWDWYLAKRAGKAPPAIADEPQLGFFRKPSKAFYGARKTFVPVVIYWEGGEMRCREGDRQVTDIVRIKQLWNIVNEHDRDEKEWRRVAEENGLWDDEHELVQMGHNRGPDDIDWDRIAKEDGYVEPSNLTLIQQLHDNIDNLSREAERRLKGEPVADQEECDRVANLADALSMFHKIADGTRARERQPHDTLLKSIQAKWLPWLGKAEVYKNLKYKLVTPWLQRLEEERKKEAAAAAAAGQPSPSEPRRPRAGTRGRAQSLKPQKRAEIEDYGKALEFFKDSPEVRDAVQALANRAVRAGITVPGCKVTEETKAV